MIMLIKLVSCSCVDNIQYYDAVVCFPSIEFTITSVYYNVSSHVWSVKVAGEPLFETFLYVDLMSFLSNYLREFFFR